MDIVSQESAWISHDSVAYRIKHTENAIFISELVKLTVQIGDLFIPLQTSADRCLLIPVCWITGKVEGETVTVAGRVLLLSQRYGYQAMTEVQPFEKILAVATERAQAVLKSSLDLDTEARYLDQFVPEFE